VHRQGLLRFARRTRKRGINDVYLLRVEQLYPVPLKALVNELGRFKKAEFAWCQEEPRNMGAYPFLEPYLEWVLEQLGAKSKKPIYAGRPASAATAVGQIVEAPRAAQGVSRRSARLIIVRHGRACPGHPRLLAEVKTWMPGIKPGMTGEESRSMAEIRVRPSANPVTEATIGKWFKKPGDPVAVDEPLVELETDKVTIECRRRPPACSPT